MPESQYSVLCVVAINMPVLKLCFMCFLKIGLRPNSLCSVSSPCMPGSQKRYIILIFLPGEVGSTVHRLGGEVEQLAHLGAVSHVVEQLNQLQVIVLVGKVTLQHLRARN